MPSLNPISQTVLIIIGAFILLSADLITTTVEISRSEEDPDKEKKARLKNLLSEKMNFAFIGVSVVLVYYIINFAIFLLGHFHRN
ncbi:hypothetical protein [uncultured Clostridium sp.]|uniref:hypothetical protein n=1 Tax=uncultured Clostridium sp. TaxID=59620 RepID=UPI0026027914|nr:hypothetical protein [uncultured Clostridium sp.]